MEWPIVAIVVLFAVVAIAAFVIYRSENVTEIIVGALRFRSRSSNAPRGTAVIEDARARTGSVHARATGDAQVRHVTAGTDVRADAGLAAQTPKDQADAG
jgi:hypothetical protein